MGKRITKNNTIPCNKKHFNNLIKFLRPKVYITSSSNFKTLVQKLTGNGSISSISSIRHESFAKESDYPTQNLKVTSEMSHDITNHGQACSQIESHRESINQESCLDSSKGSIPSSFTASEPSIHATMSPFASSDMINDREVYSQIESQRESINQDLSLDSWKGSISSSFAAPEPPIQKSSRTIFDSSISYQERDFPTYRKMNMNTFDENFDMINEGQMYTLIESKSHQESINQALSVNSLKVGMPSYSSTIHVSSVQKSSATILDSSTSCQEMNFSAEYRKMESWLLEMESCSNYDSYLSNILHY
ncbi:hypothetical protein FXO38_16193 [Capsicum annuum]|nr:hypothetical protein FXO38_16193 [Capsicum annuum]KAF3654205.1 hypothetical protein FXO37_16608 [Capsicum annuum]